MSETPEKEYTAEELEKRLADRLKHDGREWYGYLTTINAPAVVAYMKSLLEGKYFTTATVHERSYTPKADVRTSNLLRHGGIGYTADDMLNGEPWAHITWSSDAFCWGISTSAITQREARKKAKTKGWGLPYLFFKHDRVEITQYNGYKERLFWTFVVENHDED